MDKKAVICHYHIYKNSGTTFDTLLTLNYGNKHIRFDGPFPFFVIDQEQLLRIIKRKKDAIAFSSHQIRLPQPTSLDFVVVPVVFVRHPVFRIRSIYKFKREFNDGTATSELAQNMSFDRWVAYCISDKEQIVHISNAQTFLLSSVNRQLPLRRRTSAGMEYDIHQAIRNINNVQLLGRTEFFNEDVKNFTTLLAEYNLKFEFKEIDPENVTSPDYHKPFNERLEQVKQSLVKKTYEKLLKVNAQDLYLFEYVSRLIEARKAKS